MLSRSLYGSKLARSSHLMQESNQNTHIRTLNPEAKHSLINQLCVCVSMYMYGYTVYICVCVCVCVCVPRNSVNLVLANSE
jgi:hypothetical protein